ncbi:Pentatricopeptide repeat-containing protein, partial [Cucurbita argyrosperma subsp. sororia]
MEKLAIPCQTKPPISVPASIIKTKPLKFSSKPTQTTIFFTQKSSSKSNDDHLSYLCRHGLLREAISAIDSMSRHGSKLSTNTYINLLQTCIDADSIEVGRELHVRLCLVDQVNPFVETKLVSMYAKCGFLKDARKVFDEMPERNLYTWSAMIGAYSREQRWKEVVELFFLMMGDGVLPDAFLFPRILQACGNCEDLETLKLMHSVVIRCGLSCSMRVSNSILTALVKCGNLSLARKFFENMDERDEVSWNAIIAGYCRKGHGDEARTLLDTMNDQGFKPGLVTCNILIASYSQLGKCNLVIELKKKMESMGITPDVYTWTSMISGFAQSSRINLALDFFKEMILAGVEPNAVTITSVTSVCASLKSLQKGLEIHCLAIKMGIAHQVLVGNSLIDMYSKCGKLEAAHHVFDTILEKDIYTWNSMIGGYCQGGYCGCIHNGDEDQAMNLFQMMENDEEVNPNTASWNSLIAGYHRLGEKNKALAIFRQMQSLNFNPNSVTILSILPVCANVMAEKKIKEIHGCVLRRNLESELPVANSLIDTYAKSGNIQYSRNIFDGMSSKDIITWNSIIAGYILHGCSDAAFHLFDQMKRFGIRPNRGTLASIIYACGISGMVDRGRHVFSSITEEHQILPTLDHYSAVVDLYGRSGRLTDAIEFIENMPTEPDVSIWTSLLTASRFHGNLHLAVRAAERLLELEPDNHVIYRLLIQAYALYGKSEQALKVRKLGRESAMKKCTAQCWVEVGNKVYFFVNGDHSKVDVLNTWIKGIVGKVKKFNNHHQLSIDDEPKEEKIGGFHCEKFAFAFGLIGSSHEPKRIKIVKNLRICGDCHQMAKHRSSRKSFLSLLVLSFVSVTTMNSDGSRKIKPISAGPFGGTGGNYWDDGVFSTIRQLVICHGAGIDSIKIQYDVKGSSIWSDKHGGNGGTKTDTVKLDFPDEYLTMIRGHYGSFVSFDKVYVRSLTFMSNKRKFGPYGVELGTIFSFPATEGKIVGFHGRSGLYLDAIGVYLKPMPIQTPSKGMIQSPNYVACKAENEGYSIIQGSVGQNYDIVLALRQKDELKKPLPNTISKQVSSSSSSESSDDESTDKRPVKKGPSKVETAVPCGPWGGSGGTTFDDGHYSGIREINVSRNVGIVYIKVLYAWDEESIWGTRAGGKGGFKHDKVVFDYPYEILTHVTGHYGPVMYMGPNVIKSLTFHTTKAKYGPFGEALGTPFSTNVKEGKIVGFHGRKGLFLDALGVHLVEGKVTPASRPPSSEIVPAARPPLLGNELVPWTKKVAPSKGGPLEEITRGVVKEPAPCGPGPWGGDGGKPWDDGVFSGIKQIYLTRSLEAFCSIQIEYDRNKQSVWSVKHGGNSGTSIHRVKLDYPHEVLTCISGYYGYVGKGERQQVIKSLTFYTSRGKFGPFGEEIGNFFTSTTTEGKVVGFHGRSSLYLDAIGVHMQHWLGGQRASKSSMFKLF